MRTCRSAVLAIEPLESRALLSAGGRSLAVGIPAAAAPRSAAVDRLLAQPPATHPERPNLIVLPFGKDPKNVSFFDSTVTIERPRSITVGRRDYFAPFATLDARSGAIKIGSLSAIQDHASLVANPGHRPGRPLILIGDQVYVGQGAKVRGPARVGALDTSAPPTRLAAGALVDGATIQPGAVVGERAYVAPGVVVPGSVRVLPGRAVRTNAEAAHPALGKVVPVTGADRAATGSLLKHTRSLVRGYVGLYEVDPATGPSPGVPVGSLPAIDNGSLAPISGISPAPGSPKTSPTFLNHDQEPVPWTQPLFPSRIIGQANFQSPLRLVQARLGVGNSIRADGGRPFAFAGPIGTGHGATIAGPAQGDLTVGRRVQIGDGAVVLAGPGSGIGEDVTIGAGVVVSNSTLGDGVTIGERAVVLDSKLAPGTVVPPGAILVQGKSEGQVEGPA